MSIKLSKRECHEIVVSAKMSQNKSLGLNVHECKSQSIVSERMSRQNFKCQVTKNTNTIVMKFY